MSRINSNPLTRVFLFFLVLICTFCSAARADDDGSSPSHRRMSPEQEAMITAAQGIATAIVAYRNVAIFDATDGDSLSTNKTIIVDGDRIADIVDSEIDSNVIPEDAEIVDGTGWYVVPGLVDSHVHLATLPDRAGAELTARRYLYGGITTVRDMAGDARSLADLARSSLINEIPAPDIYFSALMAGPSFFSDPRTIMAALGKQPGDVPWMQGITADTDMSLAVAQARGTSATGIKIYANLAAAELRRIIAESKSQDFPVWSHIEVYPGTIFDSIGASAVSHVCMIPLALLRPEGAAPRSAEAFGINPDEFDVSHPDFQRYVAELAASGTAVDATAHLYRQQEAAETEAPDEDEDAPPRRPNCRFDSVVAPIIGALHAAGVPIIAGTDFRSAPLDPFPALITEMETLADVDSMSTADVIRSATINAANVLGIADHTGAIEVGNHASLVFTTNNPLEDIGNLRSVVLTVKRGHQFWRADYKHEVLESPFDE